MGDPATNDEPLQQQEASHELIATAYHEAGHAVMCLSLGRLIKKVTILPGKSRFGDHRLGACEMRKGTTKASKNLLEDEILILFAGMVAEAQFTGEYCQQGAAQDLMSIKRLLRDRVQTESQFERTSRRLLDKTEHHLRDPRHVKAIEWIAKDLIARTTISGRAVRHFFNQAMTAKL